MDIQNWGKTTLFVFLHIREYFLSASCQNENLLSQQLNHSVHVELVASFACEEKSRNSKIPGKKNKEEYNFMLTVIASLLLI